MLGIPVHLGNTSQGLGYTSATRRLEQVKTLTLEQYLLRLFQGKLTDFSKPPLKPITPS